MNLLPHLNEPIGPRSRNHQNDNKNSPVHERMKLVQERQLTRASSSAREIALTYLELHGRSTVCVSKNRVSCC